MATRVRLRRTGMAFLPAIRGDDHARIVSLMRQSACAVLCTGSMKGYFHRHGASVQDILSRANPRRDARPASQRIEAGGGHIAVSRSTRQLHRDRAFADGGRFECDRDAVRAKDRLQLLRRGAAGGAGRTRHRHGPVQGRSRRCPARWPGRRPRHTAGSNGPGGRRGPGSGDEMDSAWGCDGGCRRSCQGCSPLWLPSQ